MTMNYIEIFGDDTDRKETVLREITRFLFRKGRQVLLSCDQDRDLWQLPVGDAPAQAAPFLMIEEHYMERLYQNTYYRMDYDEELERHLVEHHKKAGRKLEWVKMEEALGIFSTYHRFEASDRKKSRIYLRDYNALLQIEDALPE